MMCDQSKTYRYWFFYINPDSNFELPWAIRSDKDQYLLAYTPKKKFKNGFLSIHDKDKLIVCKRYLSKDEVNLLAKNYQNEIIREYEIKTKNSSYEESQCKIYITEHQYILSEGSCYNQLETIWKLTWDPSDKYVSSIRDALKDIGYDEMNKTLSNGDTYAYLNLVPDILGSFIYNFGKILKI